MRQMDSWNPNGAGPPQFVSIVPGVFTPVLAKHSKAFSLIDCISVGVDRMQRNFEPFVGLMVERLPKLTSIDTQNEFDEQHCSV